MTQEQNQQPEPRRHRRSSRSHNSGRSGRRSSSASSSKNKITIGQVLLLIWSIASMFTFIFLVEDEQRINLPATMALAFASFIGLLLFFRTIRKKK